MNKTTLIIELTKYLQEKLILQQKIQETRKKLKDKYPGKDYWVVDKMVKEQLKINKFVYHTEIHRIKLILNDLL